MQHVKRPKLQLSQAFKFTLPIVARFSIDANDDLAKVENLQRALSAVGVRRWEASKIWLESIHARTRRSQQTVWKAQPYLGVLLTLVLSPTCGNRIATKTAVGIAQLHRMIAHEKGRRVGQEPDGRANSAARNASRSTKLAPTIKRPNGGVKNLLVSA